MLTLTTPFEPTGAMFGVVGGLIVAVPVSAAVTAAAPTAASASMAISGLGATGVRLTPGHSCCFAGTGISTGTVSGIVYGCVDGARVVGVVLEGLYEVAGVGGEVNG